MVFLFIMLVFLLLVLSILTLKIDVKVNNLKISSKKIKNRYIDPNYQVLIYIYVFEKIYIGKITIDEEKLRRLTSKKKYKSKIEKLNKEIINNENNIDKKMLDIAKKIKFNIKDVKLYIELGTENAVFTAFLIPILSTAIALFLKKYLEKIYSSNFKIQPLFVDKNIFNFQFEGIFEIKLLHIINTICMIRKERNDESYERTSNRGSYDYSYE